MNIKIIDGYVTIDGTIKVSATYKLFTKEGIDICMPKERQPAPADPWVNPNRVTTIGEVNASITRLLESLAKRFEFRAKNIAAAYGENSHVHPVGMFCEIALEIRAEKENWK